MSNAKKKGKLWVKLLVAFLVLILLLLLAGVLAVEYVLGKIGSAVEDETFATIPPHLEFFETDPPPETTRPATQPTQATLPVDTTAETTLPVVTQPVETQPEEPPAPTEVSWDSIMEDYEDSNITNILLIGRDAARSDSMILLSINRNNNTICLTSFMRDMYVQIPGYSDNRINAAFSFGGPKLLDKVILKNFGVPVHGNVTVGFEQFAAVVDVLGGVDISLTNEEAHLMRDLGVKPGMNHLNGNQALLYCRIRQIGTDHARTERQRKVLMAIAEKARSAGVGTTLSFINQVLPYVQTDLSDGEILSYATSALNILASGGSIKSGKVPQNTHYDGQYIHGMQVMVPNIWKCWKYLGEFIYDKS